MRDVKIAWGITGSGHFLEQCLELTAEQENIDLFLSRAGKEVIGHYGWTERLRELGDKVFLDNSASSNAVTKLYTGKYELVVIAPVTANSTAKMACGIADTLITNLFAHAGKCRVPVVLLPCDMGEELISLTPGGHAVPVYIREIDRRNIRTLRSWENVTVVENPEQLKQYLQNWKT